MMSSTNSESAECGRNSSGNDDESGFRDCNSSSHLGGKSQNRLELLKERENRKRIEAETAQLEQENTRMRLELKNSHIQENITLQQQMISEGNATTDDSNIYPLYKFK